MRELLTRPVAGRSSVILVVDDVATVRRIAYRLLNEAGYRVLEAADGVEALDVLSMSQRVDLVILDVEMPGMDGASLSKLITEKWPDQRLLFMSAYPAQILFEEGLTKLDAPFLAKPFTFDELLKKVSEALAGPKPARPADANRAPVDMSS